MRKEKFDGSISEIMVAYQPNQELDFGPVRKNGGVSDQKRHRRPVYGRTFDADVPADHGGKAPRRRGAVQRCGRPRSGHDERYGGLHQKTPKQLVQDYMDIGVDAVCISQPSVFPYTEQALVEFFDEVIPEDYPTYIYNVPKPAIPCRRGRLHGLPTPTRTSWATKDSTQNISALQDLLLQVNYPDFQCIAGSDALTLPMLAVGGVGVISATSVPFPEGHPLPSPTRGTTTTPLAQCRRRNFL